jgi:hypothetical protein
MTILVVIPEFQRRYVIAKKTKKTGKPKIWTVNGQSLYNAALHFRARAKITLYFHEYLSKFIKEQITKEQIQSLISHQLSVSLDIYEVRKGMLPDVGNLWIWTKWFEDALQECEIIPNDNSNVIIESGRTRYHWVETDENRRLVFKIESI